MVLSGAVTFANWADKQTQQSKLKIEELENTGKKIEELRIKEKSSHEEEAQQLKNQIEKLQQDLQAKAEAKKRSVVAQAIAPTAKASNVSGSKADWMRAAGIPESQWGYVDFIVSHESGWNPNAVNRSSGACGLGQQLPCGKWAGAWNDPVAALVAMNGYVNRYGGWAGAVAFWQEHHYY